jgi:hypothetical protein
MSQGLRFKVPRDPLRKWAPRSYIESDLRGFNT